MASRCITAVLAFQRLIAKILLSAILSIITIYLNLIHYIGHKIIAIYERMMGHKNIIPHDQREKVNQLGYESGKPGIININMTKAINSPSIFTGMLRSSPDENLIAKTKHLLSSNFDLSTRNLVADDFQAVFPIIPTMDKERFLAHINEHDFKNQTSSLPNAHNLFPYQNSYFGYTVDPTEPNRVWFLARSINIRGITFQSRPTTVQSINNEKFPPQILSMTFDTNGKCYKFTEGFPAEKSQEANSTSTGFLCFFSTIMFGNGSLKDCLRAKLEGYNSHVAMPQIWEEYNSLGNALGLR